MFGEIQSFQSRAVSDDEDDEYSQLQQDETLRRKIYWSTNDYQQTKLNVDELVLADGPIASAYVYTYLLSHKYEFNSKILGLTATKSEQKIYETNKDTIEAKENSKLRTNFMHHIEKLNGKSVLVCQMFNQLKPDEFYDWINQLWSRIEFKNALVICSQNKSNFYGNDMQTFPCVKYISSEKSAITPSTYLEEPNFIGGLPGAIVHFCLLKNIPFSIFICYSASINIDLLSVKRISECVSSTLKEKNIFIDDELSKKSLLSVEGFVTSVSSLYM
jgi:hypothetical protein